MENAINWRHAFAALDGLVEPSAARRRERGNEFEGVLHAMFAEAGMQPRSRYRPDGEEIDGSFLYRARPMLFEAKWTKDPIPASSLYQFKGKLDGKLSGTLGVFFSASGYSSDAVDALVSGKELNLILFDGDDLRKMTRPDGPSIEEALDLKLRAAAEVGTPMFPLQNLLQETRRPTLRPFTMVVVEGTYDAEVVSQLAHRVGDPTTISVTPAIGRANLPRVALAQLSLSTQTQKLILIADGDGIPAGVRAEVNEPLRSASMPDGVEVKILIFEPNLESALGLGSSPRDRVRGERLRNTIRELNLQDAATESAELHQLLTLLGWTP